MKTINNTDSEKAKEQVPDIEFFGNPDTWKLVSKASSKKEKWMTSTKAMAVGSGIVLQVSTQQGDNIAESLVYIPNALFGNLTGEAERQRELLLEAQ